MYKDVLKKYLDDLASKKPAPGGGSASALVGAAGAALLAKVANFTVGKEKYKGVEKEMAGILERSEALRENFNRLCSEDAMAYKKLSGAFKLSKEDKNRKKKIQEALKEATGVPFEICKAVHESIKMALPVAEKGNVNLITDAGIASLMLKCAFQSGLLNIEINLKSITDNEFIMNLRKVLEPMEKEVDAINEEVTEAVETHLKGEG
ncbi:MAG: cyclodeaminase/cyclohydrolase family protein [Candidatus Omnitrophota bacterium]|nr:MAG: cyclodeaminase/cyclohydrolase family protein [Candidatus Omnitrophota bacterium]